MDAVVVKGCSMRFLLESVLVSWLLETLFQVNQPVQVSTASNLLNRTNSYQHEIAHHHIRERWVCYPVHIIAEQLVLFASQAVTIKFINHINGMDNSSGSHNTTIAKALGKPSIKVCPVWFSKAIHELVSNALTHNQHKADLAVAIHTYTKGNTFIVTISDNGIGISESITNKLDSAAGPASTLIDAVYSKLDGPANLFSIQALLRQMRGTLYVNSARHFLTRITMNIPLDSRPIFSGLENKKIGERNKHKDEKPNITPFLTSIPKHESEKLRVDVHEIPVNVEDGCAGYDISLGKANNVNDQASIKFVDKFSRLLLAHYADEDFNKPLAANMMSMTQKTLTRRLHRHYQLGFVEILRTFRLFEARNLLVNGEKVTNAAFDTGFSSPSYFAKCFKAEFGCAPSALAKRMLMLSGQ
jgi:AraC-like DNA-binding protein